LTRVWTCSRRKHSEYPCTHWTLSDCQWACSLSPCNVFWHAHASNMALHGSASFSIAQQAAITL
jgi:hypothetical protein